MSARGGAGPTGKFLVFDIGREESGGGAFALEVSRVFQVIEPSYVSMVPLAPPVVLGILNHHGRIITVVDPAPLLELPPQDGPVLQAVVLRQGPKGPNNLGLKVARIQGIIARADLAEVEVESRPGVAWVAQAGRRLVHVLATEPLLERLSRLFGSLERSSVQGVTV
jgi:chemotaxis signal transduction protein